MYGRGNYGSQFGQGLQPPMPPYQQHPAGVHFQQGHHPVLQPPMIPPQSGIGLPQPIPPHASAYPPQGPPIPTSNTGLPYLRPPQTARGADPAIGPHHVLPPPPPPPSSLGPRIPPPPPPPHGQAVYVPPGHQPPPPSTQQGIHNMQLPLPPPPPASSFFHQPPNGESQMPSMAPPPPPLPPSSPPKPPPPPPLPSSSPSSSQKKSPSSPINNVSSSPIQSDSQVPLSGSTDNKVSHSQDRYDAPICDESLSLRQSIELDLPPHPPKPANEKVVRNIEVLCHFIGKNGLGFEEMARQNEFGNPDFNFLFGGEPGSEASCAHEYYLWMKKKCGLVDVSHKAPEQRKSPESQVGVDASVQPESLDIGGTSHSPVDSDVDMEDDITQSDREPGINSSVENFKPEPVSTGDMLEMREEENPLQYSRDSSPDLNLSQPVKPVADAEKKPEKSSEVTKIGSPFRLIQNYASDDSSEDDAEPCHDEVKATKVSPPSKSGGASSLEDMVYSNADYKSGMTSEAQLADSVTVSPKKDQDDSQVVRSGVHETLSKASSPQNYETDDRTVGAEAPTPNSALQGKNASDSSGVDTVSKCKDIEREDKKNTSPVLKVDEFGRLVKEGGTDSESDDSFHTRRRGRRDRSRSRSRSPPDRRRRRSPRRSPRRRKERRSRSRSWSPKRRRSRSRSPYRTGGDFSSEKLRRDKFQTRSCFDFLKGRCYRGASCRYLHHDSDKSDSSRRSKSKLHHLEVMENSRNADVYAHNVTSRLPQENNEMKGLHPDKHDGGGLISEKDGERSKAELVIDAAQPSVLYQDVETSVTDVQNCERSREGIVLVQGASDGPISHLSATEEHQASGIPSTNERVIHHLEAEAQAHPKLDDESQNMDDSTKGDSFVTEPHPGKMSNEPTGPSDFKPEFLNQISQSPAPPLPSQATSIPQSSELQVDYNIMAPSVSFPPHSVPVESVPPYHAPLPNQQSHYPIPPNPSWNILPPPPPPPQPRPPYMLGPSMPGAPHFQQGNVPLRNDFLSQTSLRPHPGELPSHSQVGGFQHQTYHLHSSHPPSQPFGGPNLIRDDRYSQFPSQGVPSSSFAPGNVPPQSIPFPGDTTGKNIQAFPGDNLLQVEAKPTFQNHPFSQQRPPPYGPQLSVADNMSSHLGGSLSVPGYSSDPLDRDNPSRFLDIGGSRISAHYNPYASTFDQPLSSRFSSTVFSQEREAAAGSKYESSFSHAAAEGQAAGGNGSRRLISSPNSSRAGEKTLPRSGGDQYDPLFDSIEPSSKSSKKHARKQDHAADNSDIMLKLSGHHKVLDVEENNKQKEVGTVAATTSLENDEFGETADAEVGAVENDSPSSPNDDALVAEGDIEIDQVKPDGKSRKNKDSRSMKLFKVAVANFVKDVLKPQWRQGNMSKEVFKTIVKKTVDKVSGAMKNHRMPKSQAKIDHYIDSSRRKLTQLVEGYVSKYKS